MSAIGWPQRLLAALGLPQTEANVTFVRLWEQAEGTRARNNPLATTQPAPGASDFNSVGVKDYPSEAVGLDATVKTLNNGRYDGILDALRRSDQIGAAKALAASPWGTGDLVLKQLGALTEDAAGNAVPQGITGGIATGAAGAAVASVKTVGDLIGVLTNQGTWLRVLQVAGGVTVLGVGFVLLNRKTVTKAASAVGGAVPGAVAGKVVGAGAGAARAAAAAV